MTVSRPLGIGAGREPREFGRTTKRPVWLEDGKCGEELSDELGETAAGVNNAMTG